MFSRKNKSTTNLFSRFRRASSTSSTTSTSSSSSRSSSRSSSPELKPATTLQKSLSSTSLISSNSSLTPSTEKYNQKLPGAWELRYDTILCQFYYINKLENVIQFDSPLEVINH